MIDEIIADIYDITVDMKRMFKEGNVDEFDKQLTHRNTLMNKVDALRVDHPFEPYSLKAKQLMEDTLHLDQCLVSLMKKDQERTQASLHQVKKNKQVSKMYHPYFKQTNGAFIDAKK